MTKKPPKLKVKEADIRSQLRYLLRLRGWYVVIHFQGPLSHKGFADLTAIKDGITIYFETKTPEGKLSKYQEEFRDCIEGHGGQYYVVRSFEDAVSVVDEISGKKLIRREANSKDSLFGWQT